MTARGVVVVDLSNRSATVVADGCWEGTWSDTTRSTAAERIAGGGWKFANANDDWLMTIDGGTREVVR